MCPEWGGYNNYLCFQVHVVCNVPVMGGVSANRASLEINVTTVPRTTLISVPR